MGFWMGGLISEGMRGLERAAGAKQDVTPQLMAQLRELEADGLVLRTVFAEVPPRVEYEITEKARGLGPTMAALMAWWSEYGQSVPVRPAMRGRTARAPSAKTP